MPRATGGIQVHELERGKLKKIKSVEKPKGFKCGTFHASSIEERHLATGDYDGRLQIWDLERLDAKPIFDVKAHEKIVNCIDG
jgi:WD repeat-containing protein 92